MIQHEIRRPWGDGTLSIAFDSDERAIVAAFSHGDQIYGPVKVMDLPPHYDSPEKIKWAVKQTLPMFDADYGGDEYFTAMFGPEAGKAAYGAHRAEAAKATRLTHADAVRIAEELLLGFYSGAGKGQTPFDNWALVNRLNAKTHGAFGNTDRLLRILAEADGRLREKYGARA